jgi:hypothetical protein
MAKTLTVYLAADLKKFNDGMNDADRKLSGLAGGMQNMLGPALLGAAAAAGAFAIALGIDAVKAAAEDEAAAAKLAQTLKNVGQAHNTEPVENYISSLERSLGITDDELRPAYDRLIRSIGDTQKANQALSLALDISAGTGKSLDTVVQALGRAYDGNTSGLSRLGAGLDSAILKSGNMEAITAKLAETFSGQAQTAAETFQGQMRRLGVATDNLKEAFGTGLLRALGDTNGKTQTLVDAMAGLEPVLERVGASVGRVVGTLADSDGLQTNLVKSADNAGVFAESLGIVAAESANAAAAATEYQTSIPGTDQYSGPLGAAQRFVDTLKVLNIWYNTSKASADASSGSLTSLTSATVSAAIGAGNAQTAFVDLNPVVEETGKTALEAAGSYLSLYEKIAAADRAARDFAGTSGTVTSAIAAGTRGNLPNPQFRADVTPTSVANAISNLVLQSDARSGRAPNIPTSGMGVIFR